MIQLPDASPRIEPARPPRTTRRRAKEKRWHELADNLMLASRNLANVLVVEPRYADPLALVHYKKVLVTKGAMEQLKEMLS